MKKFLSVAIRAARLGGQIALKHFEKLKKSEVYRKGKHDLVTSADLASNKAIIKLIKRHFPDHDFLSEETGLENNPGTYQWVIDPLDGTTNYTIGNPLFCTGVSLVQKGNILLSVVYAPYLRELFHAVAGHGAFLNGKRIKVSQVRQMGDAIIVIGRSHGRKSYHNFVMTQGRLIGQVLNVRALGSSLLDLAYVACGRVEGYIFVPPQVSLWDTAAGVLLVREAGGRATDVAGRPWKFRSSSLLATNGLLHGRLLRRLH